jgi:predicted glycoside hydrolase/deacetylase ChbG (UPF0249 family)
MKYLIVNADDLGADPGRNKGILEGIKAGVITSVSVLPNGPASQEAMQWIQRHGRGSVSVGLHLNLSEGRPLSSGLVRLVGSEGCFLGKKTSLRLLLQKKDHSLKKEVAQELEAQLEWALSWGVPMTHINGHQHVHVFPAVVDSLISIAKKVGIAWVRLPLEEKPIVEMLREPEVEAEALAFSRAAREASGKIRRFGLRSPGLFCGLYWKGVLSMRLLEEMLKRLPHGLTELMVHPGRVETGGRETPFLGFSSQERERELETLLNPEFRGMLKKYEVILTGFPLGVEPTRSCGS